jgi:hypothetical protein
MDMERPCRRCLFAFLSLACLITGGCMQIPYFMPEINYAPAVAAGGKSGEVHAFRVDITQKTEIKEGVNAMRGEVVEYEELSRIRTSSGGATSAQISLNFSSGWRYVGVVNYTATSTGHGIALKLYRPGYETIVLKPGEDAHELRWREASDLNAQVKAVDDLFRAATPASKKPITMRRVLEPGTKSAAHREALLYGASEYERLARGLSAFSANDRESQRDLLEEANRLRSLAEGK